MNLSRWRFISPTHCFILTLFLLISCWFSFYFVRTMNLFRFHSQKRYQTSIPFEIHLSEMMRNDQNMNQSYAWKMKTFRPSPNTFDYVIHVENMKATANTADNASATQKSHWFSQFGGNIWRSTLLNLVQDWIVVLRLIAVFVKISFRNWNILTLQSFIYKG